MKQSHWLVSQLLLVSPSQNYAFKRKEYGLCRDILEFGFGRAQDTLVVLHLGPTVALVVHLQTVVEQIQIFFHFLGLVDGVRVQDLSQRINTSSTRLYSVTED